MGMFLFLKWIVVSKQVELLAADKQVEMVHGPNGGFHLDQKQGKSSFFCGELLTSEGYDTVLLFGIVLGKDGAEASWFVVIP
jgi:hypothetical protein